VIRPPSLRSWAGSDAFGVDQLLDDGEGGPQQRRLVEIGAVGAELAINLGQRRAAEAVTAALRSMKAIKEPGCLMSGVITG